MAKLHFKYGAMNSGKSDTLVKTAYNYTEQGLGVIAVKPITDTKDPHDIIARGGARRLADILAVPEMDLAREVRSFAASHPGMRLECVLIDEAQFLQPAQIDQLFTLAKKDGISVIAYGLRADFRTELFPASARLFELADNIEKLPTMCICGSQAEFNCRRIAGQFVFEGAQVAIDGDGEVSYTSLCGVCYMEQRRTSGVAPV